MELSVAWLLICGVVFVGTVISREMFLWLRNLIPKTVQCWFCHHKTEVPYTLSNHWHCPKCEQYNGFTVDGDYNATIQQHYDEKLNFSVSALGRRKGVWRRDYVLCRDCNKNQELKVQQLASFEPINPRCYDSEVEHFRAQIEKAFKLCPNCELTIHTVLRKEREELGIPRRLNTTTAQKATKGTWILCVQLLLAMILTSIGFIQTNAASSLKALARPVVLSFLKSRLPSVHSVVRSVPPGVVKSTSVVLADYVVLAAIVSSLLAYYRTGRQSVALLINSLVYLVVLGISLGYETRPEHLPLLQVAVGITLFGVTFCVLKNIYADVRDYQQRQQVMLVTKTPKRLHCTPSYSLTTSTPRATPPESRTYTYEDAPTVSVKSVSPRRSPPQLCQQPFSYADASSFVSVRSRETIKNSLRDVGLEPGIRGLNLGSTAREDDVRSLWNGSVLQSTFSQPNASSWTAYSGQTNLTTQSVPVNFGGTPLQHIYSPCPGKNLSRPTSPASVFNRTSPVIDNTFSEYNLRKRTGPSSIISPASFR